MLDQPLLLHRLEQIAAMLALGAGVAIAILAVLISVDIFGREVLAVSIQGTDEIGGYVLAFVGSLGMSLTLLRRGHPRIDLFFRFFPKTVQDMLHVLAQATMAGFAIFLAWHALGEFRETLRFGSITNTPLQTPLWIPQVVWVAGLGFFALTACVTTAHALLLLLTKPAAVSRVYGPPTVDEEVGHYVDMEGTEDARD